MIPSKTDMRKHLLLLAILTFSAISLLHGQAQRDTSSKKVLTIHHADRAEVINQGGREVSYLYGNIVLSHDSTYMYCDTAVLTNKNSLHAWGNVIIRQSDSLTVFSDTLDYESAASKAVLTGEVVLKHNDQELWTNELEYNARERIAYYNKGATMFNDSLQLTSKRGLYWARLDEAKFIDSVVVIGSQFSLLTDSIRYLVNAQRVKFLTRTVVDQDGNRIYCEDGYYDIARSIALFARNAQYLNENQRAEADSILYVDSLSRISLLGNARFIEDDLLATGDKIIYFEDSGDTEIIGNAFFRDKNQKARGHTLYYNKSTDAFRTVGRTTVTQGSSELIADEIYQDTSGMRIARGNAFWRDTVENSFLRFEKAIFDPETEYLEALEDSIRPLFGTIMDDGDTLFMSGEKFITYSVVDTADLTDTVRQTEVYYDVRIFSKSMQGVCDSLAFNTRDSIFRMFYDPILWSDTTQFFADTVLLHLRGGKLDHIEMLKNSLIIQFVLKYYYNQIKGKYINAEFFETELERVLVEGNAESVYYIQDEAGAFIGVDKVQCARITFTFVDQEIDLINKSTDVRGEVIPMNDPSHSTLRLEGFKWISDVRPKTVDDLY